MKLFFIRHAQSENNALWTEHGSDEGRVDDPALTGVGLKQAQALAAYLKNGDPKIYQPPGDERSQGFELTHLYSSLMLRSVQTGTIVSEATGLRLHAWEEIHECGGIYSDDPQGGEPVCLPGKDRTFFETNFPGLVLEDKMVSSGWWNRRPIETPADYERRARRFYQALLERHSGTDHRVGIISHGGFYVEFARAALHLPERNGLWFTMYNTAISLFDFKKENRVNVVYHNRVEHLPGELVT